jgi:hypothetical protein
MHPTLCKLCGNSYLNDDGVFQCKYGFSTNRGVCDHNKVVKYDQVQVDLTVQEIAQLTSLAEKCGLDFDTYCSKLLESFILKQINSKEAE